MEGEKSAFSKIEVNRNIYTKIYITINQENTINNLCTYFKA